MTISLTMLFMVTMLGMMFWMDRPGRTPLGYTAFRIGCLVMVAWMVFNGLWYLFYAKGVIDILLAVLALFAAWYWNFLADKAADHREVARQHAEWKAMWR